MSEIYNPGLSGWGDLLGEGIHSVAVNVQGILLYRCLPVVVVIPISRVADKNYSLSVTELCVGFTSLAARRVGE